MPIYAYRCESCGFGKDVLQKLSDAPLTRCPECGAETFRKQVTAAGFQLKGSGWYVTDFRGGNASKAPGKSDSGSGDASSTGASSEAGKSSPAADAPGATAATSSAPSTPAATPAATGGASSS
jgi:putative FmdB family regulatory protein